MSSERQTPVLVRKRKHTLLGRPFSPNPSRHSSSRSLRGTRTPSASSNGKAFKHKTHSEDWTKGNSTEDATEKETNQAIKSMYSWLSTKMKSMISSSSGSDTSAASELSADSLPLKQKKRKCDAPQFQTPARQNAKGTLSRQLDSVTFQPEIRDTYDISFAQSPINWDMKTLHTTQSTDSKTSADKDANYGTSFLRRSNKPLHNKNIHSEHLHSVYKGTYRPSPSPLPRSPSIEVEPPHESIRKRVSSLADKISMSFMGKTKGVKVAKDIPDLILIKEQRAPPPTKFRFSFKFDDTDLSFGDDYKYYQKKLKERQLKHERIHKEALEATKPVSKLIPNISGEDETEIQDVWKSRGNDSLLIATVFNIDVHVRDFRTLADGKWLNDTVIEAYLKTLETPKIHCFNSFFYENLSTKGYTGVARWMKRAKKQLKNLDRIVCPININSTHWVCAVIDLEHKVIKYMDSLSESETSHGRKALARLEDYLVNEAKKQACPEIAEGFSLVSVVDCPQQPNGTDCGVFTLMNALHLAKGTALTYDSSEATNFRRVLAKTILDYAKEH